MFLPLRSEHQQEQQPTKGRTPVTSRGFSLLTEAKSQWSILTWVFWRLSFRMPPLGGDYSIHLD